MRTSPGFEDLQLQPALPVQNWDFASVWKFLQLVVNLSSIVICLYVIFYGRYLRADVGSVIRDLPHAMQTYCVLIDSPLGEHPSVLLRLYHVGIAKATRLAAFVHVKEKCIDHALENIRRFLVLVK